MTKADLAEENFDKGFSCSQAVFGAFAESLGMDFDIAMKTSEGFRGGMCMGGTCGAVTGAFMAIGLKYGRSKPDDTIAKDTSGEKICTFAEKFKSKTDGKITCKEILGCDMTTPEGKAEHKEKNLRCKVCVGVVRMAAETLEEMGF